MSDYTVYDSDQEFREALDDVEALLQDFRQTQQAIDEQRSILAEQTQGTIAIWEKKLSDYEEQRAELDQRQAELMEQRKPFEEARDRMQLQLDAKQDSKLAPDSPIKDAPKEIADNPSQSAAPEGPVTKAEIEALKSQLSKPAPELSLDPPGCEPNQAEVVDKDLKLMAKIDQKQGRLDKASQNLRDNWKQSQGPKR